MTPRRKRDNRRRLRRWAWTHLATMAASAAALHYTRGNWWVVGVVLPLVSLTAFRLNLAVWISRLDLREAPKPQPKEDDRD
jgi:hypothetical protein